MPYESDAQRRFMHARHPEIAKRWDKEHPDQKGLPEHVKKSSVEQRLLIRSAIKLASQVKRGGVMDLISQLGSKVAPALDSHIMSPLAKGLKNVAGMKPDMLDMSYQPFKSMLAGPASAAAGKVAPYAEQASDYLGSAALGGLSGNPNAARNIGLGTVGAVGGLGLLGLHNRNKEQNKQAAAIGTPYTDGILSWCLKNNLNSNQVLDMLEKGAAQTGKPGQECKAFLDRLLAE